MNSIMKSFIAKELRRLDLKCNLFTPVTKDTFLELVRYLESEKVFEVIGICYEISCSNYCRDKMNSGCLHLEIKYKGNYFNIFFEEGMDLEFFYMHEDFCTKNIRDVFLKSIQCFKIDYRLNSDAGSDYLYMVT